MRQYIFGFGLNIDNDKQAFFPC